MGVRSQVIAAVLASCCAYSLPAKAGVSETLQTFEHGSPQESQFIRVMLIASEATLEAVNRYLVVHSSRPFYCMPEKLQLTPEQMVQVMRGYMDAKRPELPRVDAAPIADVLLYALEDTFPCAK